MKTHREVFQSTLLKIFKYVFKLINCLKYTPSFLDTNLSPTHLFHLVKPNAGKLIAKQ